MAANTVTEVFGITLFGVTSESSKMLLLTVTLSAMVLLFLTLATR